MPTPSESTPTRQRLLVAAAHVFAEQGFDGSSIRDICARAQANVAAIHYHFGGKDELFAEVLSLPLQQLDDSIPQFGEPGLPLAEALRRMFLAMLAPLRGGSAEAAAMRVVAQAFGGPRAAGPPPEAVRRHHEALGALLRRHLPAGTADDAVRTVGGALVGMAMHAVMGSLRRDGMPAMSAAQDEHGIDALARRLARYGVAIVASEENP